LADKDRDSKPSAAPRRNTQGFARQLANVMDLPFVLVGSVVIGAGLGYLLDARLRTSPVFALLFGVLGFGGGMFEVIRRLSVRRPAEKQKDGK
jgi:F0F1-type ATP synthase assembly protein I